MGKKFVGLGGLKHFWTKAKTWIAGQITAEVTAKITEIVANAPEDLDTLKEIADWIKTHANDAGAMNTQINTNKNDIAALQTSVAGKAAASHTHDDRYYTESEIDTKLSGKSDTGHTHTKSQITDFPTSLPANGGKAATATSVEDGYNVVQYKATSFNGYKMQDTQEKALYVEGRELDSGDSGGIAITNDGVTVFGAGDTDGVLRVINEDNVSVGTIFKVMKDGQVYTTNTIHGSIDGSASTAKTATTAYKIRIGNSNPSDGDIWIQ